MELTPLEMSVAAMFGVFMEHQGDNAKLTKAAFLKLMKEQLPAFHKGACEAGCEDEIFGSVDLNEDGLVDFKEFASLITSYAWSNFEALQEVMKTMKK